MSFTTSLLTVLLTLVFMTMQAQAKAVYAHFIVGNAAAFTPDTWTSDIQLAKAAGIDGFALNIANDDYTTKQVGYAYDAAAALGFTCFLSFDYAAFDFSAGKVIELVNRYKDKSSQARYNNLPIISTFEGVGHVGDWAGIKSGVGGAFVVPEWTSLKGSNPDAFKQVDGALSWDVWPNGPNGVDPSIDSTWQDVLAKAGNKAYMMGVSPWFYTNLPGKNWLWNGDDLWHNRWQQIIDTQPELVEILTWNDYGESHYIGPLHDISGVPDGAHRYVENMSHDGWRDMLPSYIAAYKSSNASATVQDEKLVFYHRPNPASSGNSGGTTGNNPTWGQQYYDPAVISKDLIFVDALVHSPADITIQIGTNAPRTLRAVTAGVNHLSVPFNGQTGAITYTLSRNGQTVLSVTGPGISANCKDGLVNWNAYVGSKSTGTGTSTDTGTSTSTGASTSTSTGTATSTGTGSAASPSSSAHYRRTAKTFVA